MVKEILYLLKVPKIEHTFEIYYYLYLLKNMKKNSRNTSRRNFIKKSALMAASVPFASTFAYSSTNSILGAGDTVNVGVVGLNSRGNALLNTVLRLENTNVVALCDVDVTLEPSQSNLLNKTISHNAISNHGPSQV